LRRKKQLQDQLEAEREAIYGQLLNLRQKETEGGKNSKTAIPATSARSRSTKARSKRKETEEVKVEMMIGFKSTEDGTFISFPSDVLPSILTQDKPVEPPKVRARPKTRRLQ